MASQDHRVEKLETEVFAALSPAGRIREVLRAKAEGNEDLADRIVELCPIYTYRMTDFDYRLQCECALLVFMHADSTFEKYAFACRIVEGLKDLLVPMVKGGVRIVEKAQVRPVPSRRVAGAAGAVILDPSKVDEAEEKALSDASDTLAWTLTAMRDTLHGSVRAIWAGFDAFCQSQLHLDGWTFAKGWCVKLDSGGAWTWVQGVLSEPPPANQSAEMEKYLEALAVAHEAACREMFLARSGKSKAPSGT